VRTFVLIAVTALAVGCKGKPKHRPPPPVTAPGSGSSAVGSGSASGPAPDIVLPHGDGTAPHKTKAPLTAVELLKLARLGFTGFQIQPHAFDAKRGLDIWQKTEDHPRIITMITISRCGGDGVLGECLPMDLAKWQEHKADFENLVPAPVRGLSDTVFEIGTAQLNKTPVISIYVLGFTTTTPTVTVGSGSAGSGSNALPTRQTHAYALFYNDGINQIRVVSEYGDTPKPTRAELVAEVPRADLESVAKAFLDVYTQLW
jgi:hypothetical protein